MRAKRNKAQRHTHANEWVRVLLDHVEKRSRRLFKKAKYCGECNRGHHHKRHESPKEKMVFVSRDCRKRILRIRSHAFFDHALRKHIHFMRGRKSKVQNEK